MNTQIEKMARDIGNSRNGCFQDDCLNCRAYGQCMYQEIAQDLYTEDYRKQEWISVEDRLPVREGKYLVCTTNGNIGVGNFIDYYGKGTHLCFDCWAVTHWMPLPEPPTMKGGAG